MVNMSDLNPEKIRSIGYVTQFFKDIVEHIKMTPYGNPVVVRFGKDPFVTGISGFQLIEESNIACHLVEQDNSGYFDVFSCCEFDVEKAISFIKNAFEGKDYTFEFVKRRAPGMKNG